MTVAQLRWVFHIDEAEAAASLAQPYLDDEFPGLLQDYQAEDSPGREPRDQSLSIANVFPSGSLNQATLPPPARGETPFSSFVTPS
jgi:hypothetical protein